MRAYERLLNYVRVYTTSDPESGTHPSAEREFDLARQLVEEMKALGIEDARVDEHCYVYGSIPATPGCGQACPGPDCPHGHRPRCFRRGCFPHPAREL